MKKYTKKKTEDLINLGVILRQLRQKSGYKSAEQFSYDNDLNRTAYWRWENGENMTMKSFLKLCNIHNIRPKDFFSLIELKFNTRISNSELTLNESNLELKKSNINK